MIKVLPTGYASWMVSSVQKSVLLVFALALTEVAPTAHAVPPGAKSAPLRLITKDLGRVGDGIATRRQVIASSLLEDLLYRDKNPKNLAEKNIGDRVFQQETQMYLFERAVLLEAKESPSSPGASSSPSRDADLRHGRTALDTALKNKRSSWTIAWLGLGLSPTEEATALREKLDAKEAVRSKMAVLQRPVSETDLETFYKNNRAQFGSQDYTKAKAKVRRQLEQRHLDERLREWADSLKLKHNVRNFLQEGAGRGGRP
jgi:hypothetical protein